MNRLIGPITKDGEVCSMRICFTIDFGEPSKDGSVTLRKRLEDLSEEQSIALRAALEEEAEKSARKFQYVMQNHLPTKDTA